jgi:hypothetical protein
MSGMVSGPGWVGGVTAALALGASATVRPMAKPAAAVAATRDLLVLGILKISLAGWSRHPHPVEGTLGRFQLNKTASDQSRLLRAFR